MYYNYNDVDWSFTRLTVKVRVKQGDTLKLGSRYREIKIDWGEGLGTELTHLYKKAGIYYIDIVGDRINWLIMDNWRITEIYLDQCPYLSRLCCRGNYLKRLNLLNCPLLVYVDCSDNMLETVSLTNRKVLKTFKANNNELEVIDFSGCSQLCEVELNNNSAFLTIIRGCKKLSSLWLNGTKFTPKDWANKTKDFLAVAINSIGRIVFKGENELIEQGKEVMRESLRHRTGEIAKSQNE